MTFHIEYPRFIPARKPEGHAPAAPRYGLRWSKPVTALVSEYFALQAKDLPQSDQAAFFSKAREGFVGADGPDTHEIMRTVDSAGYTNAIMLAYWTDSVAHARWEATSPFVKWFKDARRVTGPAGLWRETICVPYDRHETIYSDSFYRVGLGLTRNSEMTTLASNGYFGAARDRLPISAIDSLESPYGERMPEFQTTDSAEKRLRVSVPLNVVTLRSGQYWAHAEEEQLRDYVDNMRPRLMTGMDYLVANKQETGTLDLRVMTNLNEDGSERRETSVYAHFLSLAHLERWSASHETHLDIYRQSIAMSRKYKEKRQFVSWHELFVLSQASFEYVNCQPATGLLPYFEAVQVSA